MSETIDVESILRLHVEDDETLVFVLPEDLDHAGFQRAAETVMEVAKAKGIKVLVVNSRIDLAVVETRSLEDITSQVAS